LSGRGTLFLVVGPSGAGKDALIGAARAALEPSGTHRFPRRFITRPAEASENHIPLDQPTFDECAAEFALSWRAHGLSYGIPGIVADELTRGIHVVVNVSRSVAAEARARFAPVRVIEVTAPAAVRAARLKARGREAEAEIAPRLERQAAFDPDVVVVNDGPLYAAVAQFLAALKE
jgi:ribose 1,5-bisphosphokinase